MIDPEVDEIPHQLGDVLVAAGTRLLGVIDLDLDSESLTVRRYNTDRQRLDAALQTLDPIEAIVHLAGIREGFEHSPDQSTLKRAYNFFVQIQHGYNRHCNGRAIDLADEVYEFMATIGLPVLPE